MKGMYVFVLLLHFLAFVALTTLLVLGLIKLVLWLWPSLRDR